MADIKNMVKKTRWYRKLHRWIASLLFVFFFFISTTGLVLGWKKNTNGYLLAKSHKGKSSELSQWLSFDSLHAVDVKALQESVSSELSPEVDRIDARPEKGMVKIVFADHYWAVQLDASTGKVLHMERRRADFIEHLHDGSYFDKLVGSDSQAIKLGYTSVMGLSLLMLTVSGFWLWYNPKRIRKKKIEITH
jgi:uncharacterized iron-regulated membrane protein